VLDDIAAVTTVRGHDRPRPRAVFLRLRSREGRSSVQTIPLSTIRAATIVLATLLTVACATPPHPPTGAVWGYRWTPGAVPSLEIIGYTADRPSCEYSRVRSETRGGVPVPSQLSAPCQQLDVLPRREGAASVYWVFVAEAGTDHFAAGGNDPGVCANLRREALKALPPGSFSPASESAPGCAWRSK